MASSNPSEDSGAPTRRPWQAPELTELPKLTDLTLISGIVGTGGSGGTVF